MAEESSNTKPNIVLIVSDDFGYGDAGVYGGGENRGMPTPSTFAVSHDFVTVRAGRL